MKKRFFGNMFLVFALICVVCIIKNGIPSFAAESTSSPADSMNSTPFESARSLMKEGKYQEARKLLSEYKPDKSGEKRLKGFLSVIDYQDPDWYYKDYSGLKENRETAVFLIMDLLASQVPKNAEESPREWINAVKTKFVDAMAVLKCSETVPIMINLLDDPDVRVRLSAISALEAFKSAKASEPLWKYLQKERIPDQSSNIDAAKLAGLEEMTRAKAVEAIVSIGDLSIIDKLKKEISDRGSPDRRIAAAILTGFENRELIGDYKKLLTDSDDNIRVFAASALKDMGDGSGFETLKTPFGKADTARKINLSMILSRWENKEAAELFWNYLKGEISGAKFGFIPLSSLGRVPDASGISDPDARLSVNLMNTLISWDEISPPLILKDLVIGRGNSKYLAAEILAESGYKKAIPVLKSFIGKNDPIMTYYSLWALGRFKDTGSKDLIKTFLNDKDDNIKVAAAWALARMNDDSGIKVISDLIGGQDSAITSGCIDALYYLRKKDTSGSVISAIGRAIPDPVAERIGIILAGTLMETSGISILSDIARNSGLNSYYAAEALYRLNGNPQVFAARNIYPDDFRRYGEGYYSGFEAARAVMSYMMLKPQAFGKIRDLDAAYVGSSVGYGEFGIKTEGYQPPGVREIPDSEAPVLWQPAMGDPVFIKDYKGKMVFIESMDGKSGWIPYGCLEIVNNSVQAARERIIADYGCRNKNDFIEILERDYLPGSATEIKYTNPSESASAEAAEAMLDFGTFLSGRIGSPPDWKNYMLEIDHGKKIIFINLKNYGKILEMTFDSSGSLDEISIK